jgi:outer membrane protein TolC
MKTNSVVPVPLRHWLAFRGKLLCGCLALSVCAPVGAQTDEAPACQLSLRQCIEMALVQNRALQIERINPQIASLAVSAAYGYYDPVFASQAHSESATDTGGFDPADFSRDAIYSAKSEVANLGLTGFLPSGLSYNLGGSYAHSAGTRNFLDFDSFKLVANVSVSQPLLKNFWIDPARAAIRINKKSLQITELGVAYLTMDTINQVQQAYYELLFAIADVQVHGRLLGAKERTLAGVRRQMAVGTLTVLEERLALSQAAKTQADLISASNAVAQAENALKTLLGFTQTHWASGPLIPAERLLVVPVSLDVRESWQQGFAKRPDLAQMKADLERADINLKFRRNQLFPSLDLVAGYGRRGASAVQEVPPIPAQASFASALEQLDNAAAPSDLVGIVFSIPLSRTAERANFKAGKQLKAQAQLRLQQKEELVLREISDAVLNARSALDRVAATRQAREYAHAALEAEEQKLAGGKSSLFFVLQLQGDLAFAESAEIRAQADYTKALSQLHFAEGSLLERARLVLEIR